MTTSLLEKELAPLNAQIEQVRAKLATLEADLHRTEATLENFATYKQRYDALQEISDALDRLTELKAENLFWEHLASPDDAIRHRQRLQERIAEFPSQAQRLQERKAALEKQIALGNDRLGALHAAIQDAYAREQRRLEELVIEREISPVPARAVIMPWSSDSSNEREFRRAITVALMLFLLIGSIMYWVRVPTPEHTTAAVVIPERLAKLVKQQPPEPEPPKVAEKKPEEPQPEEPSEKKAPEKKPKIAATPAETKAARTKAEGSGVLAFKNTFDELIDETPVAGLGGQAKISKGSGKGTSSGGARASRSLVAIEGKSGSGGIGSAKISRNLGGGTKGNADQIGGVGFSRVESSVADLKEESGRKVSKGPGPSRTDEEIQIVFDRYKATLYRIYNKELRKDPTLRGKILLKITIEEDGTVSKCLVEKTDLNSKKLVSDIVERVQKFNFGPKQGTPKTTILYPIDFLPAG